MLMFYFVAQNAEKRRRDKISYDENEKGIEQDIKNAAGEISRRKKGNRNNYDTESMKAFM